MSPFVTENFRDATIGPPTEAGIKGWLLVLTVVLLFVGPIRVAFDLGEYSEAIEIIDQIHSEDYDLTHFQTIVQVQMVSSILFGLFSVFVGVMLSTRNADGAIVARAYFKISIAFTILLMIAIFFIYLPSDISNEIRTEYAQDSFTSLISLSLWLLYIYKSKRVKATFPEKPLANQSLNPTEQAKS